MGGRQSKEAHCEEELANKCSGVTECSLEEYLPRSTHEGETTHTRRDPNTPPTPDNSITAIPDPSLEAIPISSPHPEADIIRREDTNDGRCPENAVTITSDSEDDLVTLLRKARRSRAPQWKSLQVKREDNWESLDIKWCKRLEIDENKPKANDQATCSPPEDKNIKSWADDELKVDTRKPISRPRRSHSPLESKGAVTQTVCGTSSASRKNRKRGFDDYREKSERETAHTTKKSRVAPYGSQTRHSRAAGRERTLEMPDDGRDYPPDYLPTFRSKSRAPKPVKIRERVMGSRDHPIEIQDTTPRPDTPHPGGKGKVAPFRRAKGSFTVQPDPVPKQNNYKEPRRDTDVVATVDSGEIPNDIRPATTSGRRKPGGRVAASRIPNQPTGSTQHEPDDSFPKFGQLAPPRTQSEEREAARIRRLSSRQRARGRVVPTAKWGYTIKYVHSADLILDDEDRAARAATDRTFADRARANAYLDRKTGAAAAGGLEAVACRKTTLEGPDRLLRVDILLANGEHHLMWVERGAVMLDGRGGSNNSSSGLKEGKRRQVQWQPTPRPAMPHYVVTCDLIRYDTSAVTRTCRRHYNDDEEEEGDDDDNYYDDDDDDGYTDDINSTSHTMGPEEDRSGGGGGPGSLGLSVELRIEKLPPATFTLRELANEHAGRLFLARSRVDRRFAEPADVHWWRRHALPAHQKAVAAAAATAAATPGRGGGGGGLYELAMDAHGMGARLGWDQILVHVHEVEDVEGPVNF